LATELPQRLAAILAADIAGYTRLMERDERGVVAAWRLAREQVIHPAVSRHRGRIVKLTGDGFLAEFSTVESAVKAALEMQLAFADLFADVPAERRVAFRMGINLGDIWVDAEDIYGAGVNIAARLEGLAEPGGLCISGAVYEAVKHKIAARYEPMGPQTVKHVAEPIDAWRVGNGSPSAALGAGVAALAGADRAVANRRPWLLRAIAALAVAATVAALVARDWDATVPNGLMRPAGALRMAVLPLRNLSGDSGQEYLSDGITDEMISELGRLHPERLSVIARTSVMRYKDSSQSASEIGRELGVDYVLEGSVAREGDTIRVIQSLIDVQEETQLWGERFERRFSGILALQNDVARGIAESLALALLPDERTRLAAAREVNPAAYDAYLKGRFHWYRLTPADADIALNEFNRSLALAPESALAQAWISIAHASRAQLGLATTLEAYAAAKPAAQRALELDAELPEAHLAAATVHTWQEWDWPAAEREFQRAIALNASYADVRAGYSHYLTIVGRPSEATEQIERAVALDPFNPLHRSFHAAVLMAAGRCEEATTLSREVLQIVPDSVVALTALTSCLRLLGMPDEEVAEWRRQFTAQGDSAMVAALDRGRAEGGYRGAMASAAALLDERALVEPVPAVFAAGWHLGAGNNDRALEWLERAYNGRDQDLPYINSMAFWDPLRSDPRFSGLVQRMNLATN
jgi:class 3 adenylate cyclase/TolB-like protein